MSIKLVYKDGQYAVKVYDNQDKMVQAGIRNSKKDAMRLFDRLVSELKNQ